MKVLQIVQKPQRRGAEVFALQLSHALRAMGHDVRTAYLYPCVSDSALPLGQHDVVLNDCEHHRFARIPGIHPSIVYRLVRLIQNWKPQIVQVNGGQTLKYGAAASVLRTHPWVLIARSIGQPGCWIRGPLHRAIYSRLVMPCVQGIVGVSSATLQGLAELYTLSVPVARIPRAVDPAALVPASSRRAIREATQTPLDARVVLFVGSLTPEKRLDRLVRVATTVRRRVPDLHLWIVGEGPVRPALELQVRDSGMQDRVRFTGTQSDVASYLVGGDLVALTSDTEGMPGVILEAGLLGRPVVSTRVGGVSECVLDDETGVLVEPGDESGFVQALETLLQAPEQLGRLGDAARTWVERHFTVGHIAPQYETFYEQLLVR